MPVNNDGKWESWATRLAREKFEAEQAADAEFMPEPVAEAPKPKRQRRGKAAAEAAIAEATGQTVEVNADAALEAEFGQGEDFTNEPSADDLSDLEDIIDIEEQPE